MDVQHEDYLGFKCLRLSNGRMSAWLTTEVGLRLIGLALPDSQDVMAHLPEEAIPVKGGGEYRLRGGHRLWHGPEVPARTYLPDNQPVETTIKPDYVSQRQPIEESTGVEKAWHIELKPGSAELSIDHRLTNKGDQAITLAPWAITMLQPGGLALLPQQVDESDPNCLQPNRHLVLWPYTRVESEFIQIHDEVVCLRADMKDGALKIGLPNPQGWLAYLRDDLLFVKASPFDPAASYIDRGASSQVYCSPEVLELETLGPRVTLAPGQHVEHREVWTLTSLQAGRPEVVALYEKYCAI